MIQHRVCEYKCLLEITEPSGAPGQPGLAGVWELGMIIVGDEARKVGSVQTLKAYGIRVRSSDFVLRLMETH